MALILELALTPLCWIRNVVCTQHPAPSVLGRETHLKSRLLHHFEKGSEVMICALRATMALNLVKKRGRQLVRACNTVGKGYS